jgi:hypothetical protein
MENIEILSSQTKRKRMKMDEKSKEDLAIFVSDVTNRVIRLYGDKISGRIALYTNRPHNTV